MKYETPIVVYPIFFALAHMVLQVSFGIVMFFVEQTFSASIDFSKDLPLWIISGIQFVISVGIIYLLYKVIHKNRLLIGLLVINSSHITLLSIVWYLGLPIEPNELLFDIISDVISVIVVYLIYAHSEKLNQNEQ